MYSKYQGPGAEEGGKREALNYTRTASVTLDSDPVVFSILSSWAAGQAGVQTCILDLYRDNINQSKCDYAATD